MFALLLALCADPAPPSPAASTPSQAKPSPQQEWLDAHNAERSRLGLKPLIWSDRLARDAAEWAETMARTNSFEHAPPGKEDQGENLWMGTKAAFPPNVMVQAWVDERVYYRRAPFPGVSTTGKWEDVGHYTQLIWHSTREVGCALSSNTDSEFLVCRYLPAGNVISEDAEGPKARAR